MKIKKTLKLLKIKENIIDQKITSLFLCAIFRGLRVYLLKFSTKLSTDFVDKCQIRNIYKQSKSVVGLTEKMSTHLLGKNEKKLEKNTFWGLVFYS